MKDVRVAKSSLFDKFRWVSSYSFFFLFHLGIEFQVYLNVYCIWFKNILFSASKLIRWSSFMKILQYTVKILDPTGSGLFSRIQTFLMDPVKMERIRIQLPACYVANV